MECELVSKMSPLPTDRIVPPKMKGKMNPKMFKYHRIFRTSWVLKLVIEYSDSASKAVFIHVPYCPTIEVR